MRNKKTFVAMALLVAVLVLGVGYAAISNITLNITGDVGATATDANFNVAFDETVAPVESGKGTIDATYTDGLNAVLNVSGLTTANDEASGTFTIKNSSPDLGATLSASVTNDNKDYFEVTYSFGKTSLGVNDSTTITVTVKLKETPINDQTDEIAVAITATATEIK